MMTSALLNGLWQGALIVATTMLVLVWVPPRQAATRHALWLVALLALAIVPFTSLWHPLNVTLLPMSASAKQTAATPWLVSARAASISGNWILLAWFCGTTIALIRLALSYVRIARIITNSTPAPHFGNDVRFSDGLAFPIAAGLFEPVIVIPADLGALERRDLDAIVGHERAHVQRRDVVANLVQRIIEALLFFNPWVYVIGRQLVNEREAACDDRAVHATGEPQRYASCLTQLAFGQRGSHAPLLTPSAIGSRRMLVARIARLLNGKATDLKTNYFALGAATIALAILAMLLQTAHGSAHTTIMIAAQNVPANCNHDIKVTNPVAPDIPRGVSKTDLQATAAVTVAADGRVIDVKIAKSSGNAAVDKATVEAARDSTYSPAVVNCKNEKSTYAFHVDFHP